MKVACQIYCQNTTIYVTIKPELGFHDVRQEKGLIDKQNREKLGPNSNVLLATYEWMNISHMRKCGVCVFAYNPLSVCQHFYAMMNV